jgi:hypothetical protein
LHHKLKKQTAMTTQQKERLTFGPHARCIDKVIELAEGNTAGTLMDREAISQTIDSYNTEMIPEMSESDSGYLIKERDILQAIYPDINRSHLQY